MNGQPFEQAIDLTRTGGLDQLEAYLQGRLIGRVRDVHLLLRANSLILQGHAHTYYAKQLAQQVVMEATDLPILANAIEVF